MLVLHYRGQGTAAFELFSVCMWLSLTEKMCSRKCCIFPSIPEPLCDPKICLKCVSGRPGLCPGPRWGSSRRSARPPSRLGRGIPLPTPHILGAPTAPRLSRLRRSLLGACGDKFSTLQLFFDNSNPVQHYLKRSTVISSVHHNSCTKNT